MQTFLIIVFSILGCVMYGIIHDQITARICVEYFTIGHPPIFETNDPTILGVGWGILATWWVGLFLGLMLSVTARIGHRPKRSAVSLIRIMLLLALSTGIAATISGLIAFCAATNGWIELPSRFAGRLSPRTQIPFLVDLWIHNTSYIVGFLGGLFMMAWVWWTRITMARLNVTTD